MGDPVRLVRHADVLAAAMDATTFSSRTSTHLHVPNGMDGDEHRMFREIVDRQMTPQIVAELEPMLAEVARGVVAELPRGTVVDAVRDLGEIFAVRAQCRWLGWAPGIEAEMLDWMAENYAAARAGDPERNAAVAAAFDEIVASQVAAHRDMSNRTKPADATSRLLDEQVEGRELSHEEIVSVLRNWTAGDLGSLARCVGVVVHRLAEHPRWQQRVRMLCRALHQPNRSRAAENTAELDAILAECLRIDDPFVANRRVATCPVTTPSGVTIDTGDGVLLDWVAANRDPEVFSDRFDPAAHADDNLVFGAGPHVCPGRDLSFAELRAVIGALLDATEQIEPAPGRTPTRHRPPIGGWEELPVVLR
ncbi:cytochrome P450 [Microbacterium aerolatum]|uniref:Cytochrome P450 n=1 Tax=Microbacterium aerolatum TaxID=153731 RepID=A0A511AEX1_9MICO|nr:cytochrome P450 [Microbacterium aerolatum]GEK86704.1 cytochrome P450 [Microbacterium aerolatum]GGB19043.1 cytochrome P450 [Microbacterium aerolatum]